CQRNGSEESATYAEVERGIAKGCPATGRSARTATSDGIRATTAANRRRVRRAAIQLLARPAGLPRGVLLGPVQWPPLPLPSSTHLEGAHEALDSAHALGDRLGQGFLVC